MAAIDVVDLVVAYGERRAVDGVSFAVAPGEVVVLLGPNGAGKTSTVETLEGYRRPTAGTVRVLGADPSDQTALGRRAGIMLQDGGVYPSMRAGEAVALFCAYYGRRSAAATLLDRVGLTDRARTTWRQLSGGERQRLSLALALAGEPEVVFLDEPTAGVDLAGRRIVRSVVRELADRGVAMLLTTHELGEAERLADRLVILDDGRVAADGTLADLRDRVGRGEVRFDARPGVDLDRLAASLGVPVRSAAPGRYVVEGAGSPGLVAALTAWLADEGITLDGLDTAGGGLEALFDRLTGGTDT
ncbi:MAG: ABC transporter ATP-binding protein [Acidimicrobiales bacterium]